MSGDYISREAWTERAMYDELIKNLRICSLEQGCNGCTQESDDVFCCDKLLHQAADAIEELQAQLMYSNDAAKAIAEKVPKMLKHDSSGKKASTDL